MASTHKIPTRSGDSSYTSIDETCGFGHVPLAFGYFSILSSRGGMSKQSLDVEFSLSAAVL